MQMRYELNFDEDKVNDVLATDGASYDLKGCCKLLNELNDECKFLAKQRDYWKQKYEEGTETFTFPPNCDECDFLGNNGICGYCKFTLNCYDSKEDLIDGEVLPNCPLKPLTKKLNEQQDTIFKLQDLCGKSDGENMKLRIENKKLKEEIRLLKPTNIEQYEQIVQLQKENEQLQAQLREKEEDEQLYANEIVKLNKEAKEVLDFKSLGGDY